MKFTPNKTRTKKVKAGPNVLSASPNCACPTRISRILTAVCQNRGYVLVFTAGVLWGFIGLFIKQMELHGATPMVTSWLRVLFAFLVMLPLCIARTGWRSLRMDRKSLGYCVLLGIVCHGVYNIFYSLAVTLAGVSISAVLLNIAPVFTLLCSALCFGERVSVRKMLAIAVNVIGCILTVTNGQVNTTTFSLAGILFSLGAGFCYALTAIFGRFAAERADPFVMSMYSYFAAAILLFGWARPWSQDIALNGAILFWGLLYALIPTAAAYILYYAGLQQVSESSKVPVIASIETVIAAAIGIFLYQEELGVISLLGTGMVLVSIGLMNTKNRK